MKRYISAVVVVVALGLAACARSIGLSLPSAAPVTVHLLSSKTERTLSPGSISHVKLGEWLVANQQGWSPYLATPPALGIILRAPGLSLQVIDTTVLATTSEGVFSKSIGANELTFVVQ